MTYLWGKPERVIIRDVTEEGQNAQSMLVKKEIEYCNPNDYAIVIIAANYVDCRLREIPPIGSLGDIRHLSSPPAVRFVAGAMMNPNIVKGAMCHALWILTPIPELLKERKVICHTVVLADIVNAGAIYVPDESHIVVDDDLVTARSLNDLEAYCETLLEVFQKINTEHEAGKR